MPAGIKANPDGSAAIQVGGTDVITLTSGGAATFVTSPTTVQAGTAAAPSITTSGDTNTGIFFPAADTIAFAEGGAEALRINSSGTVVLSGGDTSANGTGITFPATQSASSNANTLDDYEEGSWTPTLQFGTANVGITYSLRQGQYIKIGRHVTAWFLIQLSNKGSSTGNARITSLPFTASGSVFEYNALIYVYNGFTSVTSSTVIAYMDATTISELRAGNSTGNLNDTNFSNTSYFWGAVTYLADA